MTLLERARTAALPISPRGKQRKRKRAVDPGPGSAWQGAGTAVASVVTSLALVCLPVVVGWAATEEAGGWTDAVGVGLHAWLLGHFVDLEVHGQPLSLTPLLLAAVPFLTATAGARRVVGTSWAPALGFVIAYALSLFVLGSLTWTGLAGAEMHGTVIAAVLFPAAAYALACVRTGVTPWRRADHGGLGTHARGDRNRSEAPAGGPFSRSRNTVRVTLMRSAGPAALGVGFLMTSGTLVVLAGVGAALGRVGEVYTELGTGLVGAVLLSGAQLAALPNFAVWAVSFLAGPGISLGRDTMLDHASAEATVLPMVPVFAAVPEPGPLPSWLWLGSLVPVLVGAVVGWRATRTLPRLSAIGLKLRTALVAALLCAAAMGVLAVLANGGLGASMLQDIGAPMPSFALVLAVQLALGAVPGAFVTHWLGRRRR